MFRHRIYAQGFTLLAMVAGSMYYKTDRIRRKEFEGVIAEKKAKEKNEAWIRELEARDREDKEWKVRMGKITAAEAEAAEREKEKEVENKKSNGIVAAVNELVPGDKKPKHNEEVVDKGKQTASGAGKGARIIATLKKELGSTQKEKKGSGEDAVEGTNNQLTNPRR